MFCFQSKLRNFIWWLSALLLGSPAVLDWIVRAQRHSNSFRTIVFGVTGYKCLLGLTVSADCAALTGLGVTTRGSRYASIRYARDVRVVSRVSYQDEVEWSGYSRDSQVNSHSVVSLLIVL